SWLKVIAELAAVSARRVVPGHGSVSNWPGALDDERRYLEKLAADVGALVARGERIKVASETAAASERARWQLFDDYNARNATATLEPTDPWAGRVQDIFSNRLMYDAAGVPALEMPVRAEDAAIVPVTMRVTLSPTDTRRVRAITLVIDQNPAPMAARFELGQD